MRVRQQKADPGMIEEPSFVEINPDAASTVTTAAQISSGIPVPKVRLLQVFSATDWEAFTEEWLMFHKQRGTYHSVRRCSGPGDLGLDVVAFTGPGGFAEPWDSFQCKHYDHPLTPVDVYGEIGKIIYHSFRRTPPFNQAQRLPRRHDFVAPKGVGIKLGRLLKDPARLRDEVRNVWEKYCAPAIGKDVDTELSGALLEYFEEFDFSIFGDRTGPELIQDHAQTPFHASRFGGGLPPRGAVPAPPAEPATEESPYLRKLLDAYSDHTGTSFATQADLESWADLRQHYDRQRVLFYHAEALRNFARDRLPPGAFDSLQDDVFYGVVEVCGADYASGLDRLRATITAAGSLDLSGNALGGVTHVPDKQGVCHQLANDDRLNWTNHGD